MHFLLSTRRLPHVVRAPLLVFGFLGVLASGVGPAGADGAGARVELVRKEVWKPGDDVTVTMHEDSSREIKFLGREEAVGPSQPLRVKTEVVAIEHCVETDADGRRTRYAVTFSAWSVDNGIAKDESLQGAVLEVKGFGKDRTFSLTSSPSEPTKPARGWLDRHYGAGRREAADVRQAWLPKLPVAVGDTWTADLAAYVGATAGDRVDLEKASSECKLVSVDSGLAHVSCAAKLPFAGLPGGKSGPPTPWTKGGTQAITGTLTVSLVGRLVTSTATWSSTLEGEASAGDKTVSLVLKTVRSLDVRYVESARAEPTPAPKAPVPVPKPR